MTEPQHGAHARRTVADAAAEHTPGYGTPAGGTATAAPTGQHAYVTPDGAPGTAPAGYGAPAAMPGATAVPDHPGPLTGHEHTTRAGWTDPAPGRSGEGAVAPAAPTTAPASRDRVRWSAVWAGTLTALATFLVLQLAFFAFGWLDLAFTGTTGSTTAAVVSGVLSLVAFLVGGLVAGASELWRSAGTGALHGALVWALGVTTLLVLALLGGTALLGGGVAVVAPVTPGVNPVEVVDAARVQAGWAALWLALSLVAATLGGLLGAKMWPRRGTDDRAVASDRATGRTV